MKKKKIKTEQELLIERLEHIGLFVCDPGCYDRCKECPATVVQDAINYIRKDLN